MLPSVLQYLNLLKKVTFPYYDRGVISKIPIWLQCIRVDQ